MPTYPQARYWLLTIPHHEFLPYLPNGVAWIRGQLESGSTTGYLHWQLCVALKSKQRLATIQRTFGTSIHAEPSRSDAADSYVWKDDTRVPGTQFELGTKPFHRNSAKDWADIKAKAINNQLDLIPPDVYVQHYRTLRAIASDNAKPTAVERSCTVFWGPTGVGKSRRAWELAGLDAYPKDPCTKFWCGYSGQEMVVIDEFRGAIAISHLLRWLDRYPVIVEIKGSATVLKASHIYITSNLDPRNWYPDLDELTVNALLRRLNIIYCPINLYH